VLHPWLKAELTAILATLPEPPVRTDRTEAERRAAWERWQAGLTVRVTLPARLPPPRMLLILDNLTGHKTPRLILWLVARGVMPLDTPLGGSWLNLAESLQRILVRRALAGETPSSPDPPRTTSSTGSTPPRAAGTPIPPVRVGRQPPAPSPAEPPTAPPRPRRLRCLHPSSGPSPTYGP
jgi:hypothetical protein